MYNYGYDYGYNAFDGLDSTLSTTAATIAFAVLCTFIAIASIIAIIFYVFESLAFYTIAKNRGIENPWLAWIPVANAYLVGKIGDYYTVKETGKSNNFAIIMLCISIGSIVLPVTVIFAFLAYFAIIALAIFNYICIYKFYRNVTPQNVTVLLVLSIIFPVAIPFILFAHRNKVDVYIPQQPQYAPTQPYQQAPYQQAPYQQVPYQQAPYQQAPYQQPPVQQTVYQQPVQPQTPTEQAPVQPQAEEKPDWEK